MGNTLFIECLSGISGDMTIGALLDLGIDKVLFQKELSKINIDGYTIEINKKQKNGITGTKFDVILDSELEHEHFHGEQEHFHGEHSHGDGEHNHSHDHNHHIHQDNTNKNIDKECNHIHRNIQDIYNIIDNSDLSIKVKNLSKQMFEHVAMAEAKVHGKKIEEVHFHEVGAVDSIVDIIGTAIAIEMLNVDEIVCSPIHVGTGFVKCAHGKIPVPAPATLEILKNVPIYSIGIRSELVTPTGAAIVKTLANSFSERPMMEVENIGYGLGTKDLEITNVLRMTLGKKKSKNEFIIIEANIDDMNPEFFEIAMEHLLSKGALDVYFTSIQMKKNRPGTKLSVLCKKEDEEMLTDIILKHTSTFGVRAYEVNRTMLDREFVKVDTKYGKVTVKTGILNGEVIKISPEYEECKSLSKALNINVMEIYNEAIRKFDNK